MPVYNVQLLSSEVPAPDNLASAGFRRHAERFRAEAEAPRRALPFAEETRTDDALQEGLHPQRLACSIIRPDGIGLRNPLP